MPVRSSAPVLADYFAHDPFGVGAGSADIARRDYKAEIAEPALDAAEPAVTTAVKINLASSGRDLRVRKMCFERDQRRPLRWRSDLLFSNSTGERARASGSVEDDSRSITRFTAAALNRHSGNARL